MRYAAGGLRNQPFHPAMMVKVLVYAYASGVFSSRKMARKLHEDAAFRVLAADNFHAHRTIREFRALHLSEFTELFIQVVRLAREMGLVKLGTLAVDGSKIKANASRHKAMSYGRMQTTEAELKAQDSFTDPESRIMKRAGGGFDYAYKAQTAVDATAHIIVAAEVVNTSSDVQQLPMVLAAVKTHTGSAAGQVLADAGYRSEAVMAAKFDTEQGQLDDRKRKWIAEPPNGWIKNVLGFRQFSMRGLEKAKAEFKLVCLALNLRRMGAMQVS